MDKSQVDTALSIDRKRKTKITIFSIIIILLLALSGYFFYSYFESTQNKYIYYDESSSVSYDVYLKDNDFYKEDHVLEGNKYISSLIDYINVEYNYTMEIKDYDATYNYQYDIIALLEIKEKNDTSNIYDYSETIFQSDEYATTNNRLLISKPIRVDYNKYNDIAKHFVDLYDLENTESNLKIILRVNIITNCPEFEKTKGSTDVTLYVPLNTKTFSIDYITNIVDKNNQKFISCQKTIKLLDLYCGIVGILLALGLFIYILNYSKKTKTKKTKYQQELKKILKNYSPYIQKASNKFDISGYAIVKIEKFEDMLEIRDTITQPILMIESKTKTSTFFMIPSNTNLLYVFKLSIDDQE